MTMLKATDNILLKPIENKLNIQMCPYAELFLTHMIKFETGKFSCHEFNVHLRKEV